MFPVVLEIIPGYFIYAGLSEPDLPAPEDYSRAGPSGYTANLTKACPTYICTDCAGPFYEGENV